MAIHDNKTSRRAMLGALVSLPAMGLLAAPAIAEIAPVPAQIDPDAYSREDMDRSFASGQEIANYHMARAWIDRWKALGGDFGLMYNPDGTVKGVMRGMTCCLELWTPTDTDNPKLPPHTWLVEERHHDGAVRALEGLLEMVPGLRDTVREIAGYYLLTLPIREA